MKTLRKIQNVAIIIGLITALAIADGENATRKELWAALVIMILNMLMIAYRHINEERRKEK